MAIIGSTLQIALYGFVDQTDDYFRHRTSFTVNSLFSQGLYRISASLFSGQSKDSPDSDASFGIEVRIVSGGGVEFVYSSPH